MRSGRGHRRARGRAWPVLAAVGACLAVAAAGTGSTYAAFSDYVEQGGHRLGAAKVEVGVPGAASAPRLDYAGLLPGQPKTDSFDLAYRGTISGDLALEIRPDGGSSFCADDGGGAWTPRPGGALLIDFGNGWLDYCSTLGSTIQVPVRSAVVPGTHVTVTAQVQLASWTDDRWSEISDADDLTIIAHQSGALVGGFTDYVDGSIHLGTGTIRPVIPERCGSLSDYPGGVVYGTNGPDRIEGGNQGQVIFGLGGDDVLIGGNAKDCLVGGPGNDQLWGNNGKDSIDGGDGDDILIGGNGKDELVGGDGDDICYGGNGPDDVECESDPGGEGPPPPAPAAPAAPPAPSSGPQLTPDQSTSQTGGQSPPSGESDPGTTTSAVEEQPPPTEEAASGDS